MKLPIFCLTCLRNGLKIERPVTVMEIRDDGRYVTVCNKGHNIVAVLQQVKFEVLFEIGAYAIADGYYREAVSSFTSSLERFYEFVIRAILHARGVKNDAANDAWNKMAKQSERQLGGFVGLWAAQFMSPPELLSNSQVNFRNEVIHQGRIPLREEAIKYGQTILDLIRPAMRNVQTQYPDSVHKVVHDHVSNAAQNSPVSTMYVATILNLASGDPKYDERSLEELVSTLKRWEDFEALIGRPIDDPTKP